MRHEHSTSIYCCLLPPSLLASGILGDEERPPKQARRQQQEQHQEEQQQQERQQQQQLGRVRGNRGQVQQQEQQQQRHKPPIWAAVAFDNGDNHKPSDACIAAAQARMDAAQNPVAELLAALGRQTRSDATSAAGNCAFCAVTQCEELSSSSSSSSSSGYFYNPTERQLRSMERNATSLRVNMCGLILDNLEVQQLVDKVYLPAEPVEGARDPGPTEQVAELMLKGKSKAAAFAEVLRQPCGRGEPI